MCGSLHVQALTASLDPDFELTRDQKLKIQAIRESFRAASQKWRADCDAFEKELAAARRSGQADALEALMRKRREMEAAAPSSADAVKELRAVLTPAQRPVLR